MATLNNLNIDITSTEPLLHKSSPNTVFSSLNAEKPNKHIKNQRDARFGSKKGINFVRGYIAIERLKNPGISACPDDIINLITIYLIGALLTLSVDNEPKIKLNNNKDEEVRCWVLYYTCMVKQHLLLKTIKDNRTLDHLNDVEHICEGNTYSHISNKNIPDDFSKTFKKLTIAFQDRGPKKLSHIADALMKYIETWKPTFDKEKLKYLKEYFTDALASLRHRHINDWSYTEMSHIDNFYSFQIVFTFLSVIKARKAFAILSQLDEAYNEIFVQNNAQEIILRKTLGDQLICKMLDLKLVYYSMAPHSDYTAAESRVVFIRYISCILDHKFSLYKQSFLCRCC